MIWQLLAHGLALASSVVLLVLLFRYCLRATRRP